MNYEAVRRVVEEEVLKALASSRAAGRIRRAVVSESQVVAAWRRGSRALSIAPGGIVTPAARERAAHLGVAIEETAVPPRNPREVEAVVEAVMAKVIGELGDRPRAATIGAPGKEQAGRPTAPVPPRRARRVVTAADVDAARFRDKVLRVDRRARVTPLAWDTAEKLGIRIVRE